MILELYLSIMTAVESTVGYTVGLAACFFCLATIYSFFGLKSFKAIDILASYGTCFVLTAFTTGILLNIINSGNTQIGYSFYALATIMTLDALASFSTLFGAELFRFEKKLLKDSSFILTFFFDNWKGLLFKSANRKMKIFGSILLYFEILISAQVAITLSNPSMFQFRILALAIFSHSCVGIYNFFMPCTSQLTRALNSYFTNALLTALASVVLVSTSNIPVTFLILAAVLLVDTVSGSAILAKAYNDEISLA